MISEDVALTERFPDWQRPRRYRMLDWDQRIPPRRCRDRCVPLPAPRRARRRRSVRSAVLRLLRGDRLADPGEAARLADRVPAHRGGDARVGRQLAGRRSRPSLLLLESQHRYARKHFGPVTAALLRTALVGIDSARLARHALAGAPPAAPRPSVVSASISRCAPHGRSERPRRLRHTIARGRERRRLARPRTAGRACVLDARVAAHLVAPLRQGGPAADRARPAGRRADRHRAAVRVVAARPARPALRRARAQRPTRPGLRAAHRCGRRDRRCGHDRRHPARRLS